MDLSVVPTEYSPNRKNVPWPELGGHTVVISTLKAFGPPIPSNRVIVGVPGDELGGDLGVRALKLSLGTVSLPSRVHLALVNLEKPFYGKWPSQSEASLEGLPRMTDLAARAFHERQDVRRLYATHRHEFPEDWTASWEKEMQSKLTGDTTMNSVSTQLLPGESWD